MAYSKVCGKIKAYHKGSPDAFYPSISNPNINSIYVDGISLTCGNPRNHIWTFAAAVHEDNSHLQKICPCTNVYHASSATPPPDFVRRYNYFCDTGSQDIFEYDKLYPDDPLWDGAGCGPLNTCCTLNNPTWFYKELPQPTTDDIEMRVCRDQGIADEDIRIEMIGIYVHY